jgi:nucleotide-binding universal stress UspA family protein
MPVMTRIRPTPSAATSAAQSAPLLVATDGHDRSDGAVRAALALLDPGMTCHLVAVLPPLPVVTPEAQVPITTELLADRRADLRRDIEEQLVRLEPSPRVKIVVEVLDGDPATTIARVARRVRAKLIVAGLGRHKLVDRLFGAETTLSLMRTSSIPVLAVGPSFTAVPKRIVVAADFSEPSLRAARHALSIAGSGATVDLVHVSPREPRATAWESWGAEYERCARVALARMQSKLRIPVGVSINHVLLRGDPATEVLNHATVVGADLIVTGSHGHGFVARMLIGSVATKIVRASRFAVLTVPHMVALRREDTAAEPSSIMLLPRDDWDTRLDAFTRRNVARPVVIEVDDPELGARAQEHGYPFAGASYDRHDQQVHLMLGELGDRTRHLSRSIRGVTSMDVISDGQGRDLALRIAHGVGETLVTFTR